MTKKNRRALIIVCPQGVTSQQSKIPQKKADEIAMSWKELLSDLGDYSFDWPGKTKPEVLMDPKRGDFTNLLDETELGENDELFLIYFGHSYPVGPSKLAPSFKAADVKGLKNTDFAWLLDQVFDKGVNSVYGVLDTCHIGLAKPDFSKYHDKTYLLLGAHNGYANGQFSNALIDALQSGDSDTIAMLNDKKVSGITLERLFDYAYEKLAGKKEISVPVPFGSLGGYVIRPEKNEISQPYNAFAPDRTVYKRVFHLMDILKGKAKWMFEDIHAETKKKEIFRVSTDAESGHKKFISAGMVREYLNFLKAISFVQQAGNSYSLSDNGKDASSKTDFNHLLVLAIIDHLLPPEVDYEEFRNLLYEILKDGRPPDAFELGRKMREKEYEAVPDPANLKFAFRVLPYTKAFRRSNDALFPM